LYITLGRRNFGGSSDEPHKEIDYNPDVFREQFPLIKQFVYHLIYYRELHAAYAQSHVQSELWTHTIDAHLLQATIYWCMVFGSHGCNPTHWKKLTQTQSDDLEASFRGGFTKFTGINTTEWEKYWKEIMNFRNNYAAHRALDYNSPIPYFDLALKIAYYYDEWVRQLIYPDNFEEPSLKETAEMVKSRIAPLIARLIAVTRESQNGSE
jgi:hypothetical protein